MGAYYITSLVQFSDVKMDVVDNITNSAEKYDLYSSQINLSSVAVYVNGNLFQTFIFELHKSIRN